MDLSLRPYLLKVIIDKISFITKDSVVQDLIFPFILYIAMSLLIVIVFRIYDYIWIKLNPGLKRHLGNILMRRMMSHSVDILNNNFAGNLANKIKDVMSGVPDLVKLIVQKFFSSFLAMIIAVATIVTINYKFSLLLFAWITIFTTGTFFFMKNAKNLCNKAAEVRSTVVGQMVDILSNMISVHLFAAKGNESKGLKFHLDNRVIADQNRDWCVSLYVRFSRIIFCYLPSYCIHFTYTRF
ncbi:MAG: ABC transporter ATP-binding protein [Rickettsiales bacterium]|nr:MAG: ABC transporter ATP-binding protein [Rickettsiales bacterium]